MIDVGIAVFCVYLWGALNVHKLGKCGDPHYDMDLDRARLITERRRSDSRAATDADDDEYDDDDYFGYSTDPSHNVGATRDDHRHNRFEERHDDKDHHFTGLFTGLFRDHGADHHSEDHGANHHSEDHGHHFEDHGADHHFDDHHDDHHF